MNNRKSGGVVSPFAEKAPQKKSRFAGKAAVKREQSGARSDYAERKQTSRFLGNGLSKTAMMFKIAMVAGHKLTVPEMNKFKEVNARSLERVYDEVLRVGDKGNALFALKFLLK